MRTYIASLAPFSVDDPDMLGPGMVGISDTEGRSQFSLWCILAAPLFLGTDIRTASAYTLATVGNLEAIAINQDKLGVQGYTANVGSPAATQWQGGILLNLTAGRAPAGGAGSWTLSADGHITNGASGQALTIYNCAAAPGTVVFAWDAINDSCGNELWAWHAATGAIVSRMQGGAALCLAGADPASGAQSQLLAATCATGAPAQTWAWSADGTLTLAAFGGVALQQLAPPPVSVYAKPLLGGELALAVLNRAPTALADGVLLNFTQFGFPAAQRVSVRDIWQATTLGPFTGGFTTRAIDSHETLLLRLTPE